MKAHSTRCDGVPSRAGFRVQYMPLLYWHCKYFAESCWLPQLCHCRAGEQRGSRGQEFYEIHSHDYMEFVYRYWYAKILLEGANSCPKNRYLSLPFPTNHFLNLIGICWAGTIHCTAIELESGWWMLAWFVWWLIEIQAWNYKHVIILAPRRHLAAA